MTPLIDLWKRYFRKLTPYEIAARELADAELDKLKAQTGVEYAQSVVAYNEARIKRLKKLLSEVEVQQ